MIDEKSQERPSLDVLTTPAVPPPQPNFAINTQINIAQPSLFPAAAELQALKNIDPSWPDRILAAAERTMAHNAEVQKEQLAQSRLVIEGQNRANELNADAFRATVARQRKADLMGFTFLMSAILGALAIFFWSKDGKVLGAFLTGLAAIAGAIWLKEKLSHK